MDSLYLEYTEGLAKGGIQMATASIRKDFVVADDDTCARLIKAMDSPVDLDQFIDKKTIEKYENGKKSHQNCLLVVMRENKKSFSFTYFST